MKRYLFIALLASLINFTSCNNGSGRGAGIKTTISVVDFDKKITATPNVQLVDVRTVEEFADGHIKNAVNINYNSDDFENQVEKLDKNKPVLVYCLSGGRSSQAAGKLQELGFSEIFNLDGGIMKWNSAGMPVERGTTAPKPDGITADDFNKMITSKKYVLVDFNAKWCGPCKKMMPGLESIAAKNTEILSLVKIDADDNKAIMAQKGIDAIPYLELYRDGKLIWKHSGYIDEEQLLSEMKL